MTNRANVLILIVCCLFLYFIGSASINLTDPDEVFYTGTAKEMLANNSLLTPLIFGKPQFEKPLYSTGCLWPHSKYSASIRSPRASSPP